MNQFDEFEAPDHVINPFVSFVEECIEGELQFVPAHTELCQLHTDRVVDALATCLLDVHENIRDLLFDTLAFDLKSPALVDLMFGFLFVNIFQCAAHVLVLVVIEPEAIQRILQLLQEILLVDAVATFRLWIFAFIHNVPSFFDLVGRHATYFAVPAPKTARHHEQLPQRQFLRPIGVRATTQENELYLVPSFGIDDWYMLSGVFLFLVSFFSFVVRIL
ncbi:MAG: hypothetical protein PHW10_01595 [Candidatus Peribacteraceae bacterium]|nr:hypothetical protein [Candidatus Peribacteraceae bacterium]